MCGCDKKTVALWSVAFAFSVFLALIVPQHYTCAVYVSLAFDIFAFASVTVLKGKLFGTVDKKKTPGYDMPVAVLFIVYPLLQTVLCVAVGLASETISLKLTLVLNVVLAAVMWFSMLAAGMAKDRAQHVDVRQKDHHTEL
ncbi:MAG: hypothetical protein Q4C53_02540 [Clostridia bacterium]|nr:hypothetical protein [Clostridia bacterium]